jgi:hypothetical protein
MVDPVENEMETHFSNSKSIVVNPTVRAGKGGEDSSLEAPKEALNLGNMASMGPDSGKMFEIN